MVVLFYCFCYCSFYLHSNAGTTIKDINKCTQMCSTDSFVTNMFDIFKCALYFYSLKITLKTFNPELPDEGQKLVTFNNIFSTKFI